MNAKPLERLRKAGVIALTGGGEPSLASVRSTVVHVRGVLTSSGGSHCREARAAGRAVGPRLDQQLGRVSSALVQDGRSEITLEHRPAFFAMSAKAVRLCLASDVLRQEYADP